MAVDPRPRPYPWRLQALRYVTKAELDRIEWPFKLSPRPYDREGMQRPAVRR